MLRWQPAQCPELAALLNHAEILHFNAERLALAFEPGSVFEKTGTAPDSVALIRKATAEHFGAPVVVSFETKAADPGKMTVSAIENRERSERQKEALNRAKLHPKIAEATQILGARLKEIRLPDE